jgi:hypothetical protein
VQVFNSSLTSSFPEPVHGPHTPSFQVKDGLTFHVLTTAVSSSPADTQNHVQSITQNGNSHKEHRKDVLLKI